MPEQTKPAAAVGATGGHRDIKIADWRPLLKNTLRGVFSATMPSGLVFFDLMLHERNDSRWISFPAKEYKDAKNERPFSRWIDFATRADRDRFQSSMLSALDRFFESSQEEEPL